MKKLFIFLAVALNFNLISQPCNKQTCFPFNDLDDYQIYNSLLTVSGATSAACNFTTCYPVNNLDKYQIIGAIKTLTMGGGGGSFVPFTGSPSNVDLNQRTLKNVSIFQNIANTTFTANNNTTVLTGSNIPVYLTNTLALNNGTSFQTDWDSYLVIAREHEPTINQNGHEFVAASIFNRNQNGWAHNSFTDNTKYIGVSDYDHHAAFQSQFNWNGSGTLSHYYGYFDGLNITGSGNVTNKYSFLAYNAYGTGTGVLSNQYGLYVEPLTRGVNNEAIHIVSNDSWFGGNIKLATASTQASVTAPAINFFHASNVKTATIEEKIIDDSVELKIGVTKYGFTDMQYMLVMTGDNDNTGSDQLRIDVNKLIINAAKLNFTSIPTTSVGLPSGYLYQDSGFIKITP